MRPRVTAFALAIAVGGCGDQPPVPREDPRVERLRRAAYEEMQAVARRTCGAVPRRALAEGLAAVSDDDHGAAPADLDDNAIGLLFAEDVSMQRMALQRAAYDGCLEGLESRRR